MTRYYKQVLGGLLLVAAAAAAVLVYFRFRGPVGGVSPYETVNDLYEQEYMTFTAEQSVYPADVGSVLLYFRNDAPDDVVILSEHPIFAWELEVNVDGVWYSLRPTVEQPRWRFREEDCTPNSTPSGVVMWNGGEFWFYCDITACYPSPLDTGRYRIVIPDCTHVKRAGSALAVEFEVA